ncbi:MAG: NAD-dependent epimerase/dehydratase family protein [Proteobacteria bacterium]|nr:NAD-dependent epimerase/dehydratase family protein [Pseudomonadota bacterium]
MKHERAQLIRAALPRIGVDLVLINLALILAIIGRIIIVVFLEKDQSLRWAVTHTLRLYGHNVALVVGITLAIFLASGMYSRKRFYAGQYKLWAILQASGVAGLVFTSVVYLMRTPLDLPRSTIVATFAGVFIFCGGIRYIKWSLAAHLGSRSPVVDDLRSEPRRILVIGGAGYLGSVLCRQLLDEGYQVRVLDVLMFGDGAIADLYENRDFELIQGDFRHIEVVVRAAVDIDAVIHLGAIVGDPACAVDEDHSVDVNYAATRMIREVCRGYGIRRFLFASTCSVYGASDEIVEERSALNPVSLYAHTKAESERALLEKHDDDFSPTILRLATVFGLSPRPRFDLVVNLVTAMAVVEGKCAIFGGEQWRPFVHVSDVARAMIAVLKAPEFVVAGQIYNVGDDSNNMQLREVGDLVEELIAGADVVRQEDDVDLRNYRVSFHKIRDQLGFTALRDVRSGIEELRDQLSAGRLRDFRHERYSNLNYLKRLRQVGHPGAKRIETEDGVIIPFQPASASRPASLPRVTLARGPVTRLSASASGSMKAQH